MHGCATGGFGRRRSAAFDTWATVTKAPKVSAAARIIRKRLLRYGGTGLADEPRRDADLCSIGGKPLSLRLGAPSLNFNPTPQS